MPKITKQLVDSAKAPESGDLWIWDTELQGFGVRIQPSGRKTYVLRYRTKDAGRVQRKMTICRSTDAPPDKARGMARDVFMKVASGEDPAAERRPARETTITIEAMFEARVAYMKAKKRANATEVERVLLKARYNAADVLGRNTAPGAVTPADIVKFVSAHYAKGHRGAADKARGYLAAAFAWAIKSANDYTVAVRPNWGVTFNPAAAVAKDHGAIKVRDRNLEADEIRILWESASDGNAGFLEGVEACIKTLIGCGQRVQETLRMEGSEIDLDALLWKMPAHKTKGGKRAHVVPIPAILVPTLAALKAKHGDGPLFKSRTGSASPTLGAVSVSHAVRRWLEGKDAPLQAFQPRDLRRTWKSRAHDAGVDRFTRDLIQQHAKNDTGSRVYDRADYSQQMRVAMDRWSVWLTDVLNGGDGKTTIALKLIHDKNAAHHESGDSATAVPDPLLSGDAMPQRAFG
jgi:integrase